MAGEQAIERAVGERQRERIARHEHGVGDPLRGDLEHPLALIERGDLAAQVASEKARSARDVQRPRRGERRDVVLELVQIPLPAGAVSPGEAADAQVPVVVFRGAVVVVLLHGPPS